uniref:tRNA delta(2)-isopentenylpyrophosphate transferase n=1 Tax=Solanum tuberosum TaxID=4113 RepID=M1DJK5_SOLTU
MNTFINNNNKFNKKKVVFIMGATGTGNYRISVDLATHFRREIMNSDKMQIHKGLEIVTNKITHADKQGVRHYLLGLVDEVRQIFIPDADYTKEQSVLNRRVDTRVDEMVNAGLVDEVRQIIIPDEDYTKGIQLSIGVPEMAKYLMEEKNIDGDDESKKMILQASISSIKRNTRILIYNQLDKIKRLINEKMWSVHHIIATDVFKEDRKEAVDEAWRNTVLQPCLDIVERFLKNDDHNISIECT